MILQIISANPIIHFIILIHMALNPIKIIEINTANEATILDAVSQHHRVVTAPVCVSEKGIECVDGLCNNKTRDLWWTIEVNGRYEDINSQTMVKPADRVVLKYSHDVK